MMKEIKFSIPNISKKDINLVGKIIKSGWLTHGKYTTLFEKEVKNFTKAKYAVSVSSCTAGLHISCLASGFKKGDEIIVPAQTHTATAHAVEYTGATAIFADVDYPSGNLSLEGIKKKITKRTKGVILVHMAGFPCEMKKIIQFCKKKKILVLEDCAHALGTCYDKIHVGNFGVSGSFSFYPTKQITTGEGGMVITNNERFYKKIKKLKAFGIDKDVNDRKKQGDYDVKSLGFNYRMTDFQAALGYSQIINYHRNLKKRQFLAKRYIKNFSNIDKITYMPYSNNNSFFIFQIFCQNRDMILKILKKKKIGVSVHYANPLPKMSYYKKKYNLSLKNFRNANKYGKFNISLPIYPKLKLQEVDKICKEIIKLA
jgi:perosamine synthetase